MDKATAEELVDRAFDRLQTTDSFLLQNNAHERTIVHKFAEYIRIELRQLTDDKELVVDCEYNREGHDDIKTLPEPDIEKEEDRIYPDIIIHKRGNNHKNRLVIEVKKDNNSDNWNSDKRRLRILTNETDSDTRYDYDHGLFIVVSTGGAWEEEPKTDWFPKYE